MLSPWTPSLRIGGFKVLIITLVLGLLITCCLFIGFAPLTFETSDRPAKANGSLIEQQITQTLELLSHHEKRSLGTGDIAHMIPSVISHFLPDAASSLDAAIVGDLNNLASTMSLPSTEPPGGVPFLVMDQPSLPLTALPEPTRSEIAALANKVDGILADIAPLVAPSFIRKITSDAEAVAQYAETVAADIASVIDRVGAKQLQAPDALNTVQALFDELNLAADDIIQDVTGDASSELPAPVVDELSKALSNALGGIADVTNGPILLVGNLIKDNVCSREIIVDGVTSMIAGLCGGIDSAIAGDDPLTTEASATNPFQTSTSQPPTATAIPPVVPPSTTPRSGANALPTPSPTPTEAVQSGVQNAPMTTATGGTYGSIWSQKQIMTDCCC
ncbi:uncharacterized protein F4822DRAFT_58853 [Hypoxylon trugodes]|uniref:uncharacterized protein n=1 Tax=Hypoxylon trugodes TaxID=326681 RepID=UPI0021A1BAEB|nr:uncharacterized protein F4822DRAFT_58853 [Hypoxylon trugodes]KAI1384028.1 hypothetical protein F4822DRAFT_58853 [Hypoxylon trugodes]